MGVSMSNAPILLFLHGVGGGDPDNQWRAALDVSLPAIGYPDLSAAEVVAPKYPNGLRGVDDDVPLPKMTVKALRGIDAKRVRRDYERRRTAMEIMLGPDDCGPGLFGANQLAPLVAEMNAFVQADNYVEEQKIRAWVLDRVLRHLPDSGRLVIVGHSLGSVIAADIVRRLPPGLEVAGMVTIGSPLAQSHFHVKGLRGALSAPPSNLSWWVNFWSTADPVPGRRGVSTVFPWVLDQRIDAPLDLHPLRSHAAMTYLHASSVATAIGFGLFGSRSKEIMLVEKGIDIPLDYAEQVALLALRYAHLTMSELDGDELDRYRQALRLVQAATFEKIRERNARDGRPLPTAIAALAVDLQDPDSITPEPSLPGHLDIEDVMGPLLAIADSNVIRPFEIKVDKDARRRAMQQLTLEMQLGTKLGTNVFEALDAGRKALKGPRNWFKWAALGLGGAALVAATGGLALAAAPGVYGAAAVTSALAAFGPGGMIGGLLTAGTLVGAGSGSVAVGLAAAGTTAEVAEAVIAAQLSGAVLRKLQGLEPDPSLVSGLEQAKIEVAREHARLEAISDSSAPVVKELEEKLETIERAIEFLEKLDPETEVLAAELIEE